MVGKLLKHELFAVFRVLVLFAAAVFGFAALGRIFSEVQRAGGGAGASDYELLFSLFYLISIFSVLLAAFFLGVKRFYDPLFTGEGYTTFSLPVTAAQLVWAKFLAALAGMLFAAGTVLLSLTVFYAGTEDLLAETLRLSLGELFNGDSALETFERAVLAVLFVPFPFFVAYAGLSVGQLLTAHRKIGTFLILIGVCFAGSLFNTFLLVPALGAAAELSVHFAMWLWIAAVALVDIGAYLLTYFILRDHVNLVP